MSKFVVGIDVGGTNIKLGLVDLKGRIIARTSFTTKTFMRSRKDLIDGILSGSYDLIRLSQVKLRDLKGIGIGVPGLVDFPRGIVNVLTNIPGWKNVPLKKICEKTLRVPVFVDNDVNVVALGEWRYGAGKGFANIVCMTLGTGIGGGLILNNHLYRGEGWCAGESGHMPLNEKGPACPCGGWGCFERYVGNLALRPQAARFFNKKNMMVEDVSALAARKNPKALAFWRPVGEHIGNALVGVVNLLNPRRIVIGGGIANNNPHLFPVIQGVIDRRAMKIPAAMVKVVPAKLKDDAGIIGAQVLVHDALSSR